MLFDVRSDHLRIIQNILNNYIPNTRVVAFGSRVSGTAKQHSDLDLCIMTDQPLSLEKLAYLRDEFSLSNLPYKVDVIDWTAIAPDFQKIIAKNYLEIQASSSAN